MMTIEQMKHSEQKTITFEEWQSKAEVSLKGKPLESLSRYTYENIKLKPLYWKNDGHTNATQYPGQGDYRRGIGALGYVHSTWAIAQKLQADSLHTLREKLENALGKGQTAISLDVTGLTGKQVMELTDGLYSKYPFSIETNENFASILSALSKRPEAHLSAGYIASDPIASGTADRETLDRWTAAIREAHETMPALKTSLINTSVYHNGGAHAVQELAFALATGVHHVQELLHSGLQLKDALNKLIFKFSIGANFFTEIAKLRAARLLWSNIAEAYGAEEANRGMTISAETSKFTKTIYDPYVNLLRAGNEAFAAVAGGIQYLHVGQYDEPADESTEFSERLARNIQLILKEEAHMEKVVDPAGGSWYIESLTDELAKQAWQLFLEIDDKGGMKACLASGFIEREIGAVLEKRKNDIFTRKQSIIGTNVYASLQDQPLTRKKAETEQAKAVILPTRLAEPFEQLRKRTAKLNNAAVGLICLGELKSHKARMDFIAGFVAPGGIEARKSDEISTVDEAVAFIEQSKLNHYFICGTNEQYEALTAGFVQEIKKQHPDIQFYLAGVPSDSGKWEQEGIKQFVHLKSNCYETLTTIVSEMEGIGDGD